MPEGEGPKISRRTAIKKIVGAGIGAASVAANSLRDRASVSAQELEGDTREAALQRVREAVPKLEEMPEPWGRYVDENQLQLNGGQVEAAYPLSLVPLTTFESPLQINDAVQAFVQELRGIQYTQTSVESWEIPTQKGSVPIFAEPELANEFGNQITQAFTEPTGETYRFSPVIGAGLIVKRLNKRSGVAENSEAHMIKATAEVGGGMPIGGLDSYLWCAALDQNDKPMFYTPADYVPGGLVLNPSKYPL